MKRKDLIKLFERNGWWFDHEGSNHTSYTNGKIKEHIGRHTEISENLAKRIIKRNGLK